MPSDPPAPTASESTAQQMSAFIQNFPEYLQVQLDQIPTAEAALLRSQQEFSPQLTQTQLEQAQEFLPQFNQLGDEINRQSSLYDAETGRQVLETTGGGMVRQARDLADVFDKEFFDTRAQAADQIAKLFGSIDVSGLSPSEAAELERGLNRTIIASGNEGAQSAINTLAAANTFGSALETKRNSLREALNTASQFLSTANSGVDTLQVAAGRPSRVNQVAGFGSNLQGNQSVSNVFSSGNSLLSETGQNQRAGMQINANRRDTIDRINEGVTAVGSLS